MIFARIIGRFYLSTHMKISYSSVKNILSETQKP